MAEQRAEREKSKNPNLQTNGRNGSQSSRLARERAPALEQSDFRRSVISLLVFGNPKDAELAYYAAPGTSREGWQYLERAALQIRGFLESGDPPYVRPVLVDVWQGVMTPEGDCAEDAMPLGYANPARRAAEAEWFEKRG